MSYDEFQDPPQPGRFTPAEWLGHLLLCEPQRYIENVPTTYSAVGSDAVEGTITVLTAQGGPHVIVGARVFQGQLIASLREAIGQRPVLGRLGQGQAQPGRSPAWILTPTSPEDKQFASSYLASRQAQQFTEPPPNSQPQGYGQPSEQDRQWATQQWAAASASGPSHPLGVPSAGPVSVAQPPVAPPAPVPAPPPAPSPQPAAQAQSASVLELTAEQLEQMPEETKKLLLGAAYKPPAGA